MDKAATHPELLDHLATAPDGNWDAQSLGQENRHLASLPPKFLPRGTLATEDPANRHYARQSASGGCRIVRTALPVDQRTARTEDRRQKRQALPTRRYWQHLNFPARKWQAGQGDDLYRRSLYTFVCRSFPTAMVAFDAPSREECAAERPRSNIPQQALVLLNDPVFVEAAKALAERLLKEGQATDAQRLEKIFSLTLTRKPTKQEQTILLELLAEQRKRSIKTTRSPPSSFFPPSQAHRQIPKPAELAAWT